MGGRGVPLSLAGTPRISRGRAAARRTGRSQPFLKEASALLATTAAAAAGHGPARRPPPRRPAAPEQVGASLAAPRPPPGPPGSQGALGPAPLPAPEAETGGGGAAPGLRRPGPLGGGARRGAARSLASERPGRGVAGPTHASARPERGAGAGGCGSPRTQRRSGARSRRRSAAGALRPPPAAAPVPSFDRCPRPRPADSQAFGGPARSGGKGPPAWPPAPRPLGSPDRQPSQAARRAGGGEAAATCLPARGRAFSLSLGAPSGKKWDFSVSLGYRGCVGGSRCNQKNKVIRLGQGESPCVSGFLLFK